MTEYILTVVILSALVCQLFAFFKLRELTREREKIRDDFNNGWSRNTVSLSEDEINTIMQTFKERAALDAQEEHSDAKVMIEQLPGVFTRRIQKR